MHTQLIIPEANSPDSRIASSSFSKSSESPPTDSPAYSRSARAISYKLDRPGLYLEFSTGPYQGPEVSADYPRIDSFVFAYDPSLLKGYPDLKISLGSKAGKAAITDLDFVEQRNLKNHEGEWIQFHFNEDSEITGSLFVGRDNGKLVHIAKKSSDLITETLRALITQSQFFRKEINSISGSWKAQE